MRGAMIVVLATLFAGSPAFAHHPFSSEFDANAPVRVTGKVNQVDWSNPHVMIHMTDANGNRNWTFEAAGTGELGKKGWSRDTLKIGDQITVQGFRAKSEPMIAAARMIELPGGKKISAADDEDGGPKFLPAP